MVPNVTLLDLVTTVSSYSRSDAEVVATVVSMVNTGRVRLCGNFRGARFDLDVRDDDDVVSASAGARPRAQRHASPRETPSETTIRPGARIRSTRPIIYPGGTVGRATEGTVRSRRVNIGRELVTVDFDSGERLVLFPHEIEPVTGLAA